MYVINIYYGIKCIEKERYFVEIYLLSKINVFLFLFSLGYGLTDLLTCKRLPVFRSE